MSRIALFAGPSLPQAGGAITVRLTIRPPAECGDLLRAADEGFDVIALVDGLFETGPTVWHKEILHLLSRGIVVYGAASLGAIRAAELDRFGMIGVGSVYQAYRDGSIERDDAVMVVHAPPALGHRALTVALVDAEATIAAADLGNDDRRRLQAIARAYPFRDRDWPAMLGSLCRHIGASRTDAVRRAIDASMRSIKQRDTAMLIEALASAAVPAASVTPPRTLFLNRLIERLSAD